MMAMSNLVVNRTLQKATAVAHNNAARGPWVDQTLVPLQKILGLPTCHAAVGPVPAPPANVKYAGIGLPNLLVRQLGQGATRTPCLRLGLSPHQLPARVSKQSSDYLIRISMLDSHSVLINNRCPARTHCLSRRVPTRVHDGALGIV